MTQMAFIKKSLLLAILTFVSTVPLADAGVSYGSCNATGTSYYCPSKCDGGDVSDCFDCEGYMTSCNEHKICIDRKLFQPHNTDSDNHDDHYHFLWNDLVGAFVWFVTAGISIACGVGGGGIYVPLGILLFQFAPKQASGFSQASIFGASLAGLILNSRNQHPVDTIRHDPGIPANYNNNDNDDDGDTNNSSRRLLATQKPLTQPEQEAYIARGGSFYTRPIINYDMALFMSPMQMAGAVLGVLIQRVLPNWLYLLFAGIVLCYISYKTYKKYFAARETERAKRQRAAAAAAEETDTNKGATTNDTEARGTEEDGHDPDNQTTPSHEEPSGSLDGEEDHVVDVEAKAVEASAAIKAQGDTTNKEDENLELRKQYLEADMRQYPMEKIGALVLLWLGLFVLTLFQGGKGVESLVGIQCDSPWYYVVIMFQFLWLFCFAAYFGYKLLKDQRERVAVDYPYLGEEDPVWDEPSIRFYGGFCFISGVVAAMIGIGGGMVLGPLMLIMGIDPRVSTATNSTMIVVTSSSIAIMFVTSGLVPWSYALFYFAVTFAGAWIGKIKIDGYVKRTGRASMLIFILASIIAFATIGCFVILFTRLVEKEWCFEDFNPFCSISDEEDCPVDRMLLSFNSI